MKFDNKMDKPNARYLYVSSADVFHKRSEFISLSFNTLEWVQVDWFLHNLMVQEEEDSFKDQTLQWKREFLFCFQIYPSHDLVIILKCFNGFAPITIINYVMDYFSRNDIYWSSWRFESGKRKQYTYSAFISTSSIYPVPPTIPLTHPPLK